MKKILLCTTALVGLAASSALAGDMNITFSGSNKFEAGVRKFNQDKNIGYPVTANQNSSAFFSTSKVAINATNKTDSMTYGASIRLRVATNQSNGTDRESRMDRSHIFMDSEFGSIQLGTNIAASKMLEVNAGTIAAASGGVDGDYRKFIALDAVDGSNVTLTETGSESVTVTNKSSTTTTYKGAIVGDFAKISDFTVGGVDTLSNSMDGSTESADKITYLSPRVEGVQFGVSFTPDLSNGGNSVDKSLYTSNPSYMTVGNQVRLKNIWSLALNYKNNFDDLNVEAAVTGNFGKAKAPRNAAALTGGTSTTTTTDENGAVVSTTTSAIAANSLTAHNLHTYSVGVMAEYHGLSGVVSYANDGNSALPDNMNFNTTNSSGAVLAPTKSTNTSSFKSHWYTTGVAYANGPMSTSLTYLSGKKGVAGNSMKSQALSLGGDYEVAPGFKPFAEVTYATYKPTNYNKLKATVFILGTRVKF